MATFFQNGLSLLNERLSEVDLLIQEAKKIIDCNQQLYNALCRSAHVLLLSHFEGYIKQVVKDCLDDINFYSSFRNSKKALKKRLCENFLLTKEGKMNEGKMRELMDVFESLDTKFKESYFLFADNKNPKASVLNKIVENFGLADFFKRVKQTRLDLVFSNSLDENIELRNEFLIKLKGWTASYPYSIDFDFLKIDKSKDANDNLWDSFVNNILMKRHAIAHGSEIENTFSCYELEANKIKVEILIYAFAMYICDQCNPA
jgi:hypothetical protein